MKNLLITLGIALGLCAVSFGAFYAINREPAALRRAAREGDAMAWLRTEFRLDEAQFSAIEKLHADFEKECAVHCSAIAAANRRHASAAEIAGLESTCVQAMTDHFHRVASLMPPGQGERYLAIVMPRIADYDHSGAPNVQVRP